MSRRVQHRQLKRNVGLLGAASIGIANIIGSGIFVVSGVAAGLAGPSVIFSFILAGFIALLTALSTAELSSFITEEGAAYAFTKHAYGRFWSFLVGWFKYFDYIVTAAVVSVGFAAYFTLLLGLSGTSPLLIAAIALPIVLTILNIIGIKETTIATTVMVIIKVIALAILLSIGGYFIFTHNVSNHYVPLFPNGFNGMFAGTAIIFFAFLGFNTIAMISEEAKDPEKTIPRALILAFIVSFILYIGIGVVEVGVVPWQMLGTSAAPLDDVARVVSNNQFFLDFISFSALVATSSVALSSIVGGTRATFAMGRDHLLPKQLDRVSVRFGTPYISIIIGGIAITVIAGIFYNNIDAVASIVNFGSLFTFLFVHLSLIKMRRDHPEMKRPFKVPLYPVVPILGIISCLLLMVYLSNTAKLAAAGWSIVAVIVYYFSQRRKSTYSNKI